MRQFKFRVWDGKTFLTADDFCLFPEDNGSFLPRRIGKYGSLHDVENAIIQQFTGLQDSVGKDCYEGDILELCGPEDFNHHYGLVEFKDGAFIMNGSNRGLIGWLKWGEIKANIFENPEIINQSQR